MAAPVEKPEESADAASKSDTDNLHMMMRGLLQKLPPPDTKWPASEQVRWLQTAAHMFALLYDTDGEITIFVASKE